MGKGIWNCMNDYLCFAIFGYDVYPICGEEGREQSHIASDIDPLEDNTISELVFDVMCLLTSYDSYFMGDTSEEEYHQDVSLFKKKWLNKSSEE